MKFTTFLRFAFNKIMGLRKSPADVPHYIPSDKDAGESSSFFLDESALFEIEGEHCGLDYPRWIHVTHCHDKRYSLNILSGEQIRINRPFVINRNFRLFVRYAASLPEIGSSGLACNISFVRGDLPCENETEQPIASLSIPGGKQLAEWRSAELDISWLAGAKGQFRLSCQGDSRGCWLAVSDFCIAQKDQVSLVKARSFQALRIQNEVEHFKSVYKHNMYTGVQNRQSESAQGKPRTIRGLENGHLTDNPMGELNVSKLSPLPDEVPYDYASRLLHSNITQAQPDFKSRLVRWAKKKRVRVLSLCSGAARIEAGFAAEATENVEWSLLDINRELLETASTQFSPSVQVDLIEANVNDLSYTGEKWDIILCVSALHHIVELEKIISFCHYSLNSGGEFWSIGEYVGRNGNRLWPGAYEEANRFFSRLPDKFRLNQHTRQLDQIIPNNDYSVGCFEGIRSEDIEPTLDRWFHRVDVHKANCFLWRLMNLAYSDNYHMDDPEDIDWIVSAVKTEIAYFRSGGQGTELYGIYRPRIF